jgi:hypothetical protein
MSYFCKNCNYSTTDSGNFTRHKKTQKHILLYQNQTENVSEKRQSTSSLPLSIHLSTCQSTLTTVFSCEICEFSTKHKSSYYRHQKVCQKEEVTICDLKTKLEQVEFENKLKLEFSEKEKDLFKKLEAEKSELLNNFMNNANVLLNKANDNTKITAQAMQTVSVSALKYANDKFKDTPALLPLNNFNINNLDFNNIEDKEQLIETLIYCAKQQSLDKLLGDHIVKCYKKENPEEQSFHTTDCSRLNYIVRDLIENALTWAVDKSGLKICKEIVKPLIKKCIDILLEHQKTLLKDMSSGNYHKQKEVELIIDVIMSIDSGTLENDINKYIAPYFNLNKKIE